MPKQTSLFLHAGHNVSAVTLTSTDTTTKKDLFTAGANDADLKSIVCSTTDTAAVNLGVWYYDGSTAYLLGYVNVPLSSGNTGSIASVNILSSTYLPGLPLDAAGKNYLPVKAGHKIQVSCLATMTASKTTYVTAFGHDY